MTLSSKQNLSKLWHLGYFVPLVSVICWSGNFPVGRWVQMREPTIKMSALELATWRWTTALIFCALIIAVGIWRNGPQQWQLQKQALRTRPGFMLFSAISSVLLFNTFVYIGLRATSSINGLITNVALPSFILLMGFLILRDRIATRQIIGIVIAIAGVLWVAVAGDWRALASLRFNSGDLFILFAMLVYAFYSIFLRYRPEMSALSFVTIQPFLGVPMLWIVLLVLEGGAQFWPGVWSLPIWLSMLYLGIFPSIVAQTAWNRSVELLTSSVASLYLLLIPVIGAMLSAVILSERVAMYHVVSFTAVAIGLVIGLGLFSRRAKTP